MPTSTLSSTFTYLAHKRELGSWCQCPPQETLQSVHLTQNAIVTAAHTDSGKKPRRTPKAHRACLECHLRARKGRSSMEWTIRDINQPAPDKHNGARHIKSLNQPRLPTHSLVNFEHRQMETIRQLLEVHWVAWHISACKFHGTGTERQLDDVKLGA